MEHYAFSAQLTRMSPIGLVPDGLRIDVGFSGTITAGPLAGSGIEGVDYLLIRPDGVAVIDARELITGPSGSTEILAAVHAQGYLVPPFPLPPLVELLDPSFTWPDAALPVHGSARLQSAVPALADTNRTVFSFTGVLNMAHGSLQVVARSIASAGSSSAADEGATGEGITGAVLASSGGGLFGS